MDKAYCIFGDSVTQAPYIKNSWANLLNQFLEEKYKNDYILIFSLGICGDTTDNILKRFLAEASVRYPNFIVFAVGINDTKAGDKENFKQNIQTLIKLAKKFTQDITFVGLVLGSWTGAEPFSEDRTTKYNEIITGVAQTTGCKFIPLQDKLEPEDFSDGLHPNDSGHRKMFEEIKKFF